MPLGAWVTYDQTASTNVTLLGEWSSVTGNDLRAYQQVQHRQQQRQAAEVYRRQRESHWYQQANFYNQESAADYQNVNYGFGNFHVENMPADIRLPRPTSAITITREAIEKARTLLLSCLSDAQRGQFEAQGYFEVVAASGTRYRITKGWGGNVFSIHNNKPRDRFCIHPSLYVPEEDNMLAQKLLLEVDEQTFLRTANRSAA